MRESQKPRGNDLSVRNNHNGIGRNTFQEFLRRVRLDGFGLVDMQIGCERRLFDRRAADALPSAARPSGCVMTASTEMPGSAESRRSEGTRNSRRATNTMRMAGTRALRITTRRSSAICGCGV